VSARDDYPPLAWRADITTRNDTPSEVCMAAKAALDELDRLRWWKAEALTVLAEWERVWETAGRPGALGSSKAESVRVLLQHCPLGAPEPLGGDRPTAGKVTPKNEEDAT
jgi:hypothetical protein